MTENEPYPEYKESGVDWIGKIPANWSRAKIADLYSVISGAPFRSELFTDDNTANPVIKIGDVLSRKPSIFTNESCSEEIAIKKDDLIIGMSGYFNVNIWNSSASAYANQRVGILRAKKNIITKYFYYLLPQPLEITNNQQKSTIIKNLSMQDLRNLRVPLPPLETQQKIVEFLDAETAHIDAGIANMESLIALLTEKRSALILETITRGIPGEHTEFKESGVEWLGEIPVGWSVRKVENIAKFLTGGTPPTKTSEYFEGDCTWISISDLNNGVVNESKKNLSEEGVRVANIPISPKGSLLFSFKLSVGKVAIAGKDLYTNEAIATFIPSDKLEKKFAFYSFPCTVVKSAKKNIYNADLLNSSMIREAKVPLPPLETQHMIVKFLDTETAQIDLAISNAKSVIKLMKEKRQTLISDVVTGKIDVTNSVN